MYEIGIILKGVGGYYTVLLDNGGTVVAKPRGKFRLDGVSPICGDRVALQQERDGCAFMTEIFKRRNVLTRPAVANIDQLVIVLSLGAPRADLMLCDKLLLAASSRVIEELIVFNKADAASRDDTAAYAGEYSARYQTLIVSARTGANMDRLGDMLSGKISCFAGQSAVGKSSLLNALLPKLNLPVGELARRTARGRHTTRHAELWPYRSGAVLDTPGFSLLDLPEMGQDTLNACYRDFGDAPARCKFAACSHRSEPGCAVKALVGKSLAYGRYERYVALCSQLEEMRQHKYD